MRIEKWDVFVEYKCDSCGKSVKEQDNYLNADQFWNKPGAFKCECGSIINNARVWSKCESCGDSLETSNYESIECKCPDEEPRSHF